MEMVEFSCFNANCRVVRFLGTWTTPFSVCPNCTQMGAAMKKS